MDSRPEHIREVAEASLKRLKTDGIDLFYQHRVDPDVPIEDVAGAVKDLILRARSSTSACPKPGAQTSGAPTRCSRSRASERIFALDARAGDERHASGCEELGIGLVPYSPLGKGFLTGR